MLVATLNGHRIEAKTAERSAAYTCPECDGSVILKRGRIKIAHFAHKPPTSCAWVQGETLDHLQAKQLFRDAFVSRGLKAEVEYVIPSLPSDRRADVIVWSPSGRRIAVELQHTSIDIEEIEARSRSYAREGVAQAWVPFIRPSVWTKAEARTGAAGPGKMLIKRYPARPFERWAHALHHGRLWFYKPTDGTLWHGHFDNHNIVVEDTMWCGEGGEEMYGGGYSYWSKRWKELTLWGPYMLHQIKIKIEHREEWKTRRYCVPAGYIVRFVVEGDLQETS